MRRRLHLLLMVAFACAEDGRPPDFLVDLITDFTPGEEVITVESELLSGRPTEPHEVLARAARRITRGADLIAGERVAVFSVVPGDVFVRVRLLDVDDRPIATTVIHAVGADAVTARITRSCRGVSCPGAGDSPEAIACLGGVCLDPRCTPETPERCPPPCDSDEECDDRPPCGVARCVDGLCLLAAEPSACREDERCDVDLGCVGGSTGSCVPGEPCTPALACFDGRTRCLGDERLCEPVAPAASGTICAGGTCDGSGGCRGCVGGDECDAGDCRVGVVVCAGEDPICLDAARAPAGTECSVGVCDADGACAVDATAPEDEIVIDEPVTLDADGGELVVSSSDRVRVLSDALELLHEEEGVTRGTLDGDYLAAAETPRRIRVLERDGSGWRLLGTVTSSETVSRISVHEGALRVLHEMAGVQSTELPDLVLSDVGVSAGGNYFIYDWEGVVGGLRNFGSNRTVFVARGFPGPVGPVDVVYSQPSNVSRTQIAADGDLAAFAIEGRLDPSAFVVVGSASLPLGPGSVHVSAGGVLRVHGDSAMLHEERGGVWPVVATYSNGDAIAIGETHVFVASDGMLRSYPRP